MSDTKMIHIVVSAEVYDDDELLGETEITLTLPPALSFPDATGYLGAYQESLGQVCKTVSHLAIYHASEKIREVAEAKFQQEHGDKGEDAPGCCLDEDLSEGIEPN